MPVDCTWPQRRSETSAISVNCGIIFIRKKSCTAIGCNKEHMCPWCIPSLCCAVGEDVKQSRLFWGKLTQDGSAEDCGKSGALAMDLVQSCIKQVTWSLYFGRKFRVHHWRSILHNITILHDKSSLIEMWITWINYLTPRNCGCNFKNVIYRHTLIIHILRISSETVLRGMQFDHANDKSILVWVMAWCHQALSRLLHIPQNMTLIIPLCLTCKVIWDVEQS